MRLLSKMFVVVLMLSIPAWTSPAQVNKGDQKPSAAAAAKYGAGQAVDDSAGIFTFGAPAAISAGQTRYLASLGGGVTTAKLAAVVPKNGVLKNFYWTCESSTLNGNGNNVTIIVKGIDPPRQVVLTWDQTTRSGSNTASAIPVKAGETVSVRVGLTGTMGVITRISVSFEFTTPGESPWKVLDPDIYFDTGNVGIGTDTPGEKLTVDGVVEATEGFKFPDGSVQLEAAKPTGTMHSLEPADGSAPDAVFAASGGNVGIGTNTPQADLTLKEGFSSATEMTTPTGVKAESIEGGNLSNGNYYFRISASDGQGFTKGSAEVNAKVVVGSTKRAIRLTWNPSPGAKEYRVFNGSAAGKEDEYHVVQSNSFDYTTAAGAVGAATVPEVTNAYVNKLSASGNSWVLDGNVGIGTTKPLSDLLDGSLNHGLETNGWILARGNGDNTWGDSSARIGVIRAGGSSCEGWWMSANPNNTFAIHQGCVGDRLTIEQNGVVRIPGTLGVEGVFSVGQRTYLSKGVTISGSVCTMAGTFGIGMMNPPVDWDFQVCGKAYIFGDFYVHGKKLFLQDHPTDPTKQIVYVALEGGEAGTYCRGAGQLVNGKAVIDLPDHFGLVTNAKGLTVQLTPVGEWLQLYVMDSNTKQVIVGEAQGKSGRFDYLVHGVRKGYENHQVIQEKRK